MAAIMDKIRAHLRSAARLNAPAVVWCGYFLAMIILAPRMVGGDSDLAVHICYGRCLFANGFPASDPLLSGITGPPVMQEWGFDLIAALLDATGGLGGPLIVFAALFATLVTWVFHRMRRNSCFWLAMLYANLMFAALFTHLFIRPHMISWFATALLWSLLEDYQNGARSFRTTAVYSCALMLLWTNLHGGFLTGTALAGIMVAGEIPGLITGKNNRFFPMAVLLCILASVTLVNPWGWHLHEHLVSFLSNDFLIQGTSDFQPPGFADRTMRPFILTACLAVLPMLLNWRRVKAQEWLLVTGLTAAALTSVRNIPFLGIIMLPIAVRHLQLVLQRFDSGLMKALFASSARIEAEEHGRHGWLWEVGLFFTVSIAIATGAYSVSLSSSAVPKKALEWVQQNDRYNRLPVFADFLAAGFLLYDTPVQQVYLHALNAYYPEERLRTWIAVGSGEDGWEQRLHGLQWAFLRTGSPQARILTASPLWQAVYEDDAAIIFGKTRP